MVSINQFNFKLRVNVWTFLFAAFLLFACVPVLAQHDMSNMPGMSKPKAKFRSKARGKKTKPTRKKHTAKKHDMGNMPGMKMPAPSSSPARTCSASYRSHNNVRIGAIPILRVRAILAPKPLVRPNRGGDNGW